MSSCRRRELPLAPKQSLTRRGLSTQQRSANDKSTQTSTSQSSQLSRFRNPCCANPPTVAGRCGKSGRSWPRHPRPAQNAPTLSRRSLLCLAPRPDVSHALNSCAEGRTLPFFQPQESSTSLDGAEGSTSLGRHQSSTSWAEGSPSWAGTQTQVPERPLEIARHLQGRVVGTGWNSSPGTTEFQVKHDPEKRIPVPLCPVKAASCFPQCGKLGFHPRISPVIVTDTTCSVSLLTGTIGGSNFAFPSTKFPPHGNESEPAGGNATMRESPARGDSALPADNQGSGARASRSVSPAPEPNVNTQLRKSNAGSPKRSAVAVPRILPWGVTK